MGRIKVNSFHELEDPFSPVDHLHFLELYNFEDPSRDACHTGDLDGEKLDEWLARKGRDSYSDASETLRVIFTDSLPAPVGINHYPLSMRQSSFTKISRSLNLPSQYLSMLREGLTSFFEFDDALDYPIVSCPKIMLQSSAVYHWRFSVAISYDPESRSTNVLIHDLTAAERSIVIDRIISRRKSMVLPTLIPTILLAQRQTLASLEFRICHHEILQVESMTDLSATWISRSRGFSAEMFMSKQEDESTLPDYDSIMRLLTGISSKLAWCEYVSSLCIGMVDKLDALNARLVERSPAEHQKRFQQAQASLRVEHSLLRSSFLGVGPRAEYLLKRAQAQVQTVYCMIAQHDNALNSRIALAATRDSAAMRLIAAITTIFLPATFTATFFSTTFFDFQAGAESRIVSGWLWLYFVVTLSLSALVLAWWYVGWRRKQYKISKEYKLRYGETKLESKMV